MFFSSLLLLTAQGLLPKQSIFIENLAAKSMLNNLQAESVKIDTNYANSPVLSTFAFIKKESSASNEVVTNNRLAFLNFLPRPATVKPLPFVLVHGFDSSCLEYRQLAPLLAAQADVYVPDVLGWGFSDQIDVTDFGPNAKVNHLECFINQVVKSPCILIGASLVSHDSITYIVYNA